MLYVSTLKGCIRLNNVRFSVERVLWPFKSVVIYETRDVA